MKNNKITKGYKAFNSDWTCNKFKYEVGKTYKYKGKLEIYNSGFHFCKQSVDVLNHYPNFLNQKYALIKAIGEVITESDKSVCREIKIVKEVSKEEILKAFNYNRKSVKSKNTTGDYACSSTTRNYAHSSTTGVRAHSSTTGDYACSSTTGWRAHSSTTGVSACSSTTGWRAHSSTTGSEAHSSTTGMSAHSSTTGTYSISVAIGINSKARAGKNGFITIANWIYKNGEWVCLEVCSKKIGKKLKGIKLKPNTWYWFKNGKLMEGDDK